MAIIIVLIPTFFSQADRNFLQGLCRPMLDPVGVPAEPVTFMIYQEQTEAKSKRAALSPVSKRANFRSSPVFLRDISPFPFFFVHRPSSPLR